MLKSLGKLFGGGDRPDVRLNRNDQCWCGSGKKYKRCHMEKDLVKDRAKAAACRKYS